MMATVLISFIFYLVQFVLPSQCLFETSKFVKKGKYCSLEKNEFFAFFFRVDQKITTIELIFSDVCSNHFIQLDKPPQKMLASICEAQCMIVCHETEGNYRPGSIMNVW